MYYRNAALTITALALAGCASSSVWTREGATPDMVRADKAACQQASQQSAGALQSANRAQVGPGVDAAMRNADRSTACMQARGYQLAPAGSR